VASTARTSTTRLRDRYANLLYKPAQVVLFTSSLTLLPVVVPAIGGKTLLARFRIALSDVLAALGVERTAIESELAEMTETVWARTTSCQPRAGFSQASGVDHAGPDVHPTK
jgi:hypothetical protein